MTPTDYIQSTLPRMEGWCTADKATRLAELTAACAARTAVEIGVFGGRSLFAIALALEAGAVAVGIDPWSAPASVAGFTDENATWWGKLDHDAIYASCRRFQRDLALEDRCFLLRATSAQALPLISRLGALDLLHIDGNHSEESALFDVESYVPLVRSGGVVLFDDVDWKTTKRAQARLAELCTATGAVGACAIYTRR